jgi:hypothetical protein
MAGIGSLAVTEIMYHPAITAQEEGAGFSENDFEYLEISNVSDQTVSLGGVEVYGGVHFLFDSIAIAPQQSVIIAHNREAFEWRYGTVPFVVGQFDGPIGNGGERIRLRTADGTQLVDLEFDDQWYPETDGDGYSLTLVDPTANPDDWNDPANWRASLSSGGSPGTLDTDPPYEHDPLPTVSAQTLSVHHVQVNWEPPTEVGQWREFRVYRDGRFLTAAMDVLIDNTVNAAHTYRYQVSAVDLQGREGPLSEQVEVWIEPPGGAPTFADPEIIGVVDSPDLHELSGLAASRSNPSVFWANNDGGGGNTVYGLRSNGGLRTSLSLTGVVSVDWEDIAVGPGPVSGASYIYVGDIGDNDSQRDTIVVYRFQEPLLDNSVGATLSIPARDYSVLTLRYPSGPHDAEVLMVDPQSGDLFVVGKESRSSRVYRAAANTLVPGQVISLVEVGRVALDVPSGGDISPDGSEIVLRNEDEGVVFVRTQGQSIADALTGNAYGIPLVGTPDEPNGEAIAFGPGNGAYFTLSEGLNPLLYRFTRTGPSNPGDANRDGLFNSGDLVQVFQFGKYQTGEPALWSEGDWNGDGYFDTSDMVLAFQSGGYTSDATKPAVESFHAPQVTQSQLAAAVDDLFSDQNARVRRS